MPPVLCSRADSPAASGSATGVFGRTFSPQGIGVYGRANAGVSGTGVYGHTNAPAGYGVYGKNEADVFGVGVRGQGKGRGVEAISTERTGAYAEGKKVGLEAVATDDAEGIGLVARGKKYAATFSGPINAGEATFHGGVHVHGPVTSGSLGASNATIGDITCSQVDAQGMITAINYISYSHAWFESDIYVKRNIVQGESLTARVDHPLDPANQYLNLRYTTSPEELSVLSGNATTDEKGHATITMPAWFEASCTDFRYQLSCIGQFAQIMVKEQLARGQLVVQTNLPAVQFSWQVSGVRLAAKTLDGQATLPVEVAKPADEQGSYLDPARYGLGEEHSLFVRKRQAIAPQPAPEPTSEAQQ